MAGELLLDVLFAEAHKLKGLYHYLGVVVSDGAGGKLHTVADKVVLMRG